MCFYTISHRIQAHEDTFNHAFAQWWVLDLSSEEKPSGPMLGKSTPAPLAASSSTMAAGPVRASSPSNMVRSEPICHPRFPKSILDYTQSCI